MKYIVQSFVVYNICYVNITYNVSQVQRGTYLLFRAFKFMEIISILYLSFAIGKAVPKAEAFSKIEQVREPAKETSSCSCVMMHSVSWNIVLLPICILGLNLETDPIVWFSHFLSSSQVLTEYEIQSSW